MVVRVYIVADGIVAGSDYVLTAYLRAAYELEALKEEEEDYRDNIPENLQGSERYEQAEEACDNLDSAFDGLEEVISYIEEATA